MAEMSDSDDRYPSGRRKVPVGVRQGGAAWNKVHEALARTALDLIVQKGFGDMAMDDVALQSGISKRTVYRHYPNKTELGIAAIHQLPTWQRLDVGDGDIEGQVRRFLELSSPSDESFVPVLASVLAHRQTHPELLEAFREHVLVPRESALAELLERGQRSGGINPDVEPAAIGALATGIQIDHFVGLHPWEADNAGIDYAMSLIWPLVKIRT
jgi:AcrR family transcriptional regulator